MIRLLVPTGLLLLAAIVVAIWTRSVWVGLAAVLMVVFWGLVLAKGRKGQTRE